MAALLLANIHAPDFKPAITLTDLRDRHSIFWLDGFSIMYYAAPDAAQHTVLARTLVGACHGGATSFDDLLIVRLLSHDPAEMRRAVARVAGGLRATAGYSTTLPMLWAC